MRKIRESILSGTFVDFVYNFMDTMYPTKNFPGWVVDALKTVNIDLIERNQSKEIDEVKENSVC